MSLVYCGIDEAGYGPMLGPLCVGVAGFRVEGWQEGEKAPNLWDRLAAAVCEKPRDAKSRIPYADSKDLKLSNSLKTKHPLVHLERGVLSMLEAEGVMPATDSVLFDRLGSELGGAAWYGGDAVALPLGQTVDQIKIDANVLRRAMRDAGVSLEMLGCDVITEGRFNELVRNHGGKGAATSDALVRHLRVIAERFADDDVRVVCDRHGGRMDYRRQMRDGFGTDDVEVLEQSARASRYRIGRVTVILVSEAERGHLPVALASMAAKLTRELAMGRFNRYWSAKMPELKPTAGYVQDARRWLDDVGDRVGADDRRAMIRIA